MPQMSPMNWMMISIYSKMVILLILSKNYFMIDMNNFNKNFKQPQNFIKPSLIFKW